MCRSLTTHNRWKLILWWKICFTEPGSRAFSDLAPNTLLIQKSDGWCGKKIWNLFDRSSWIPWFPNSTICFAKKTSDTSMSTLARKEASQPWEQERMGVLSWRWKPISLEHRPQKHLQHTNPPCTSSEVGWLWLMADLEFHDFPQLSVCQAKHLLSLTLCSMKLHLIIGMGSQLLTKKPLVCC